MVRGSHELPKVSLGPTMPNPSKICRQVTPEMPYSHFRDGQHAGQAPAAVVYPFGYPTLYTHAKIYIKI
jgi:hypothetical protein